jgi:hypothetical protein
MNTWNMCLYLMALMACQAQGSSTRTRNCNCHKVRPILMWICVDVKHQGVNGSKREMMTLSIPSGVHHLYDNGN